ncbi:hypothetical protein [Mycolicibacterium mucogenicum]|uniref:Uncharacterized protein n=1 Tax=Mycolicibacterium mucogenicum DSM 44124 TaxID=1226753 RepID=A0A8H2JJ79_MYCMU|nr:hypothetical protein [Mycolicibacterium mucogenicum]KAB7752893.1 hypothetical protein MMUC44124_26570 [Mycolicibacterium mucogenicum DSM 44124]QPG69107.1 hypothetical protein C1S78_027590 [Mycolicibacterium mucogenicum DSM 44124]
MPELFLVISRRVRDIVVVAQYRWRNAFRPYPPLELVRFAAFAELTTNPTITVYTIDKGIEQRRAANPIARFKAAIDELGRQVTVSFERLAAFAAAVLEGRR